MLPVKGLFCILLHYLLAAGLLCPVAYSHVEAVADPVLHDLCLVDGEDEHYPGDLAFGACCHRKGVLPVFASTLCNYTTLIGMDEPREKVAAGVRMRPQLSGGVGGAGDSHATSDFRELVRGGRQFLGPILSCAIPPASDAKLRKCCAMAGVKSSCQLACSHDLATVLKTVVESSPAEDDDLQKVLGTTTSNRLMRKAQGCSMQELFEEIHMALGCLRGPTCGTLLGRTPRASSASHSLRMSSADLMRVKAAVAALNEFTKNLPPEPETPKSPPKALRMVEHPMTTRLKAIFNARKKQEQEENPLRSPIWHSLFGPEQNAPLWQARAKAPEPENEPSLDSSIWQTPMGRLPEPSLDSPLWGARIQPLEPPTELEQAGPLDPQEPKEFTKNFPPESETAGPKSSPMRMVEHPMTTRLKAIFNARKEQEQEQPEPSLVEQPIPPEPKSEEVLSSPFWGSSIMAMPKLESAPAIQSPPVSAQQSHPWASGAAQPLPFLPSDSVPSPKLDLETPTWRLPAQQGDAGGPQPQAAPSWPAPPSAAEMDVPVPPSPSWNPLKGVPVPKLDPTSQSWRPQVEQN